VKCEGGVVVSIQQTNTLQEGDNQARRHEESLDMTGLEHVFRWASEMVAEPDESRVKLARERRIRKQVLEVIQQHREQQIRAEAQDEVSYLQRRVIALLAKLQEVTEENSAVKQIMVAQSMSLERLPRLEAETKRLKIAELEKEAAIVERRYLMDGIAKIKIERDYLVDVLSEAERENERLANILNETKAELEKHKNRKWWHFFFPQTA
jgi:hypothetical protein